MIDVRKLRFPAVEELLVNTGLGIATSVFAAEPTVFPLCHYLHRKITSS